MKKTLKIRDLTLREGQQSLFGARMRQEHLDRVLPLYREAGFYITEVWGGNVPDAMMRHLGESPWERLRACSREIQGASLLSALVRGRNLFGQVPYPDYVLEGFYREAIADGLNVIRIFDSLNDAENLRESILMISRLGGTADAAVCYALDPKPEPMAPPAKKKGFFARLFGATDPKPVVREDTFTDEYFVRKVKELEAMGARIITLKDMDGRISPRRIFALMPKLKHAVRVPVDFHTRCMPGYGLASVLTAIIKGVDIVDTNIWWFAGGPAAPAIELVWVFCQRLCIEVDVDMEAIGRIRRILRDIRKDMAPYDTDSDRLPNDFEEYYAAMPPEVDSAFDEAIRAATENREADLLRLCRLIEEYFGFPTPDTPVKDTQVPAGMYAHMVENLRQLHAEEMLEEALGLISKVRRDAGMVPLVAPASHIVGSQAVALALDRRKGAPDYTTRTHQYMALVKGDYGHTPVEISPAFRELITGNSAEIPFDVNSYRKPANPELSEYGGALLAQSDEEYMLLMLLPSVATAFLKNKRKAEYERAVSSSYPALKDVMAPAGEPEDIY